MNLFVYSAIIAAVGFSTLLLSPSFAQTMQDVSCPSCVQISDTKTLEIHKTLNLPILLWASGFDYTYDHNSMITINGHSKLNDPNTPIIITVTDPIGNLVTVQQLMVPQNSSFEVKFNTGGPLWKKDGFYIIKAQGGATSTIFKTKVELISIGLGSKVSCTTKEITVNADNGGKYCIPYTLTGAIKGVEGTLSTKSKSLSLEVRGLDIQTISLDINRNLLDSKSTNGEDSDFIVLVNGKTSTFDEKQSSLQNHRNISISLPRGTNSIEIIGTHVVPEFGTVAILVLFVSIITIMTLSKRYHILNNFSIVKSY